MNIKLKLGRDKEGGELHLKERNLHIFFKPFLCSRQGPSLFFPFVKIVDFSSA